MSVKGAGGFIDLPRERNTGSGGFFKTRDLRTRLPTELQRQFSSFSRCPLVAEHRPSLSTKLQGHRLMPGEVAGLRKWGCSVLESRRIGRRGRRAAVGGLILAALTAANSQGQSASSQNADSDAPEGQRDLPRTSQRLESLGVDVDSDAVDDFLKLDRATQSQILENAGLDDPGGSLSDPRVADYLVGQFMRQERGADLKAIDLEIRSGLLPAADAIALAQTSSPEAPLVSDLEVADLRRGLPSSDDRQAARLARLQAVVQYLRPYLPSLVPDVAVVKQRIEDERIVVATSGSPADVIKALGGTAEFMGIPVEIVTTSRTPDQLASIEGSISRQLRSDHPHLDFSTRIDPLDSLVRLTPLSEEATEVLETNEKLAPYVQSGEVVVEPQEAPLEPGAIQGGWGATPAGCTWGFTVGVSGNPGLVMAAHCDRNYSYGWIPTTFAGAQQSGAVDAELRDVDNYWNGSFENEVRYDGGSVRDITSRRTWLNLDEDDWVCHEGANTGYSCGQITTKHEHELWWVTNSAAFVRIEGPLVNCQPGDSGGPWFYGNTAYGIYSGQNGSGSVCVFGAIDFAETAVGFTVLTK
ncbi:MAG: hypothetical protein GY788_16195 [bacterium]|nr:hypothetical protein [bacterium]